MRKSYPLNIGTDQLYFERFPSFVKHYSLQTNTKFKDNMRNPIVKRAFQDQKEASKDYKKMSRRPTTVRPFSLPLNKPLRTEIIPSPLYNHDNSTSQHWLVSEFIKLGRAFHLGLKGNSAREFKKFKNINTFHPLSKVSVQKFMNFLQTNDGDFLEISPFSQVGSLLALRRNDLNFRGTIYEVFFNPTQETLLTKVGETIVRIPTNQPFPNVQTCFYNMSSQMSNYALLFPTVNAEFIFFSCNFKLSNLTDFYKLVLGERGIDEFLQLAKITEPRDINNLKKHLFGELDQNDFLESINNKTVPPVTSRTSTSTAPLKTVTPPPSTSPSKVVVPSFPPLPPSTSPVPTPSSPTPVVSASRVIPEPKIMKYNIDATVLRNKVKNNLSLLKVGSLIIYKGVIFEVLEISDEDDGFIVTVNVGGESKGKEAKLKHLRDYKLVIFPPNNVKTALEANIDNMRVLDATKEKWREIIKEEVRKGSDLYGGKMTSLLDDRPIYQKQKIGNLIGGNLDSSKTKFKSVFNPKSLTEFLYDQQSDDYVYLLRF